MATPKPPLPAAHQTAVIVPKRSRAEAPGPRVALALGGGGARGLAHILVLEALDELGVKPVAIAGTSIGAIYGAGYASGLSGAYLRAHTEEVLGQRIDLARHLFNARAPAASRWLNIVPIRPAILNPESLMEVLLPSKVARNFADLAIPLAVVATDFYAQEQRVISGGPLRPAIAASMALPAIFTPVTIDGTSLVDGGLVNPLPFDIIAGSADITIAIDVSGAPARDLDRAQPSAIEVLLAASQIFQRSIVREKMRTLTPDVYIDCPVDNFSVLDFHRYREVLEAASPVKEQLRRQLGRVLSADRAELLPAAAELTLESKSPAMRPKRLARAKDAAKEIIRRRRKK